MNSRIRCGREARTTPKRANLQYRRNLSRAAESVAVARVAYVGIGKEAVEGRRPILPAQHGAEQTYRHAMARFALPVSFTRALA